MAIYLTRNEIVLCFGVYFLALSYGLYHAYEASNELPQWALPKGSLLNRRQDVLEYNWLSFKRHADEYAFWLLAHVITSEIFRILWPLKVPLAHAFIGIVFIGCNGYPWGVIFATVMLFYVAMRTSRCCIWMLAIVCLTSRQFVRIVDTFVVLFDDYTSKADFLFLYTWLIVRVTSYSLDYNRAMRKCFTDQDIPKVYSFSNYLGYVFYMPVMIHGPPLIYKRYARMLTQRKYDDFARRSVDMIWMLMRLTCSGVLLELTRHFIYAEYICENPHIADRINRWALMGFTAAIGLYFNLFYMVSYGLGIAIANFDRIDAPNQPICVARVTGASSMMRHFDQGLYEFTYRYVYRDICGGIGNSTKWRKILAGLGAFLFVSTWHGLQISVIVWCALNTICLEMEVIGKRITHTRWYEEMKRSTGVNVCDRIRGFFGSQLLMVSVITNVYFIGGEDIGKVIAHRAFYDEDVWDYVVTSAISYCCYQACEFLARREDLARKEMLIAFALKKLE